MKTNFEDHLWSYLVDEHEADSVLPHRSVPSRRRRGPLVLGGSAIGLAALAAGAALTLTATNATSPQIATAAVLRHVEHAVAYAPGTIIHADLTESQSGQYGRADTRDIWILPVAPGAPCNRSTCPAEDLRIAYQGAGSSPLIDSSTNGQGVTDIYDSRSNAVYETQSPTASFQPPEPIDYLNDTGVDPLLPSFAATLQHLVATGHAHVVGNTTVNSHTVIQIAGEFVACGPTDDEPPDLPSVPSSKPGQRCVQVSKWTYDVDPGSYAPVQMQSTSDGTTNTITYTIYQTLSAASNMDVFQLTAQHPGARVDPGAADYQAEVGQICGYEGLSSNIQTCTATPDPNPNVRVVQAPAGSRLH